MSNFFNKKGLYFLTYISVESHYCSTRATKINSLLIHITKNIHTLLNASLLQLIVFTSEYTKNYKEYITKTQTHKLNA